jgi:hypothetical protein
MRTMIATSDRRTVRRMEVITNRTGSMLIAGYKSALIENVKNQLRNGVCHFVYMKRNGEVREAFGTTCRAVVERFTAGTGCSRECYSTTAYFDIEAGAWRSFRWENIVSVF